MPFTKIIAFLILLFLLSFYCNGQTSLLNNLKLKLKEEPERWIELAISICEQHGSLSADSLKHYIYLGLKKCNPNSVDFFKLNMYNTYWFLKNGNAEKAMEYTDSLLTVLPKDNDFSIVKQDLLNARSIGLIRTNKIKEAMDNNYKNLTLAEELRDSLAIMKSYSMMGLANMELENEREAIVWLKKGISYTNNEQLLSKACALFLNIASCYKVTENLDSAMQFINRGLQYTRQIENLTFEANALNIRGAIFSKKNKKTEALKDLEDALVIRQKVGDTHYVMADMGQLGQYYAYVNQPWKGIDITKKAIEIAKSTNNTYKQIYLLKVLASNYRLVGEADSCWETMSTVIRLKDSLYEENTGSEIAEMGSKYELQKKENIIVKQENELIRSRYMTIGSLFALVLTAIIGWLIYRNYKHIQERRTEKALMEEKMQSVKAVQNAEERERKRIAADLHDNLGSYAAAISSNVRYLKEKSNAENQQLIDQLDENAQGIVTQLSDSIWALKNEQISLTLVADRFKAWAQRLLQNYPHVKYYYEEDIENDVEFTPGKMLNIFLLLKECLTNALKHSLCSEVRIQFSSHDSVEIIVADNGIGFTLTNIKKGSGITNITNRAKESGLEVDWQSAKPTGTVVLLRSTTN